jgi:hypothetical protein
MVSWLMAILSFSCCPTQADTVELTNGGKMSGTITQINFRKGGETVTVSADKVAGITAGAGGDTLTVDGDSWEGRIVDIKLKTIGGVMKFNRSQFKSVEKKLNPRDKKLADYKKKAAQLEEIDAAGWLDLAIWAGRNRLRREERAAALRSLEIDPDHKKNTAAHRILGHVLREGQWLTASEVKELEGQAEAQKVEEMRAKGFVKVGKRWVNQEEKERIDALQEKIDEIKESLYQEAQEWANDKMLVYTQAVDDAKRRASNTAQYYKNAKRSKELHSDHGGCRDYDNAISSMKRYKKQARKDTAAVRTAANKSLTAVTSLRSKVSGMKRDIKHDSIRLMRKAEAGEEIDEFGLEDKLRPKSLN